MKHVTWMALIALGLILSTLYATAQVSVGDRELVGLLEQEVGNREANLKILQQQFEAGRASQATVLQAEQELLKARQEVARANKPRSKNPLRQPIPQFQVDRMVLGEFAESLRHTLNDQVNFVLKESADQLVVPALDMKGTDLLTVLNILREVVPDLVIKVQVGTGFVLIEEAPAALHAGSPAMMPGMGMGMGMEMGMDMGMMGGFGMAPPPAIEWPEQPTIIFECTSVLDSEPRETLTVYLGALLQSMDFDDVLTSIESAWDASRAPGAPSSPGTSTLRFHEDTELLIAAGPRRQLQVVDDVIQQLHAMQEDLKRRTKDSLHDQYRAAQEELRAKIEKERKALEEKMAAVDGEAKNNLAMVKARLEAELARTQEEAAAEAAQREEMRAELEGAAERLWVVKEEFAIERARLVEKLEEKLEQAREQAYYERRQLLEDIDKLQRELQHEKADRLDIGAAAEDDS